jgi:hypothetical protein
MDEPSTRETATFGQQLKNLLAASVTEIKRSAPCRLGGRCILLDVRKIPIEPVLLQMGFQKYGMEDFAISVRHGQQEVYRSAPVQSQKALMSCLESRASGCRSS